jgi:hypothetical protein
LYGFLVYFIDSALIFIISLLLGFACSCFFRSLGCIIRSQI